MAAVAAADRIIDVLLSARSSAAITLSASSSGEQVVSAIDGADAAAHLRVGDVVLSVNGRQPGRTPSNWAQETAERDRASVLALRVRRLPSGASSSASPPPPAAKLASVGAAAAGRGGYEPRGSFGGYGLSPGMYSMPCNVIALPDGELLVADGGGCRLQVVSPTGELRHTLGARGELPGDFNYPAGLAVDAGRAALYVADRGNCSWLFTADMRGRVCVFDAESLELLRRHTPSHRLGSPHGMAVWADELFVADHDHHRVLALALHAADEAGAAAGKPSSHFAGGERAIGSRGVAPGQFEHPIGLAARDGTLFVSEFTGRRVQALTTRGVPLFVLPAPSGTRLLGVCVAGSLIFAGDFDVDRVHCWEHLAAAPAESLPADALAASDRVVAPCKDGDGEAAHAEEELIDMV